MYRHLFHVFCRQAAYALFVLSLGFGLGEWVAPGLVSTLFPVWFLPIFGVAFACLSATLLETHS